MVTGPIPAAQVQMPPTPPASVQTPPPPPPSTPSYSQPPAPSTSTSSQSVALRQTNGTDRVQISTQAMNANQGNVSYAPQTQSSTNLYRPGLPSSPPINSTMNDTPPTALRQPASATYALNQATSAPQNPGQGVQQSGKFLNLFG